MDTILGRRVLAVLLAVSGIAVGYFGTLLGHADDAPGLGVGGLLIMLLMLGTGARMFWTSLGRSRR